jgi:hypothetical protein
MGKTKEQIDLPFVCSHFDSWEDFLACRNATEVIYYPEDETTTSSTDNRLPKAKG